MNAQRVEQLQKKIADFQEASGLSLSSWNSGRLGEIVHAIQSGDKTIRRLKDQLERTREVASAVVDDVTKKIAEINAQPSLFEPKPEQMTLG